MAAPSYTTDLTTIVDFDGTPSSPTVSEPSSVWTAGRTPVVDTDFPIQSSNHASLTMNTTGKAGVLCSNASSFSWTSGDYLFGWVIWLAPGAIATKANGGLAMLCGSGVGDYKIFYVGGNSSGSYPYGGWQNFAVDPTMTGSESNVGSPTAYYIVGAGANVLSAVSKGNPLGFDVFRYGRGELRVAEGQAGNYADFAGMASANDATSARWGLFQAIAGGYKFKGLMILGYGALTNFTDSNKSIVIDDTEWVAANFNRIEIRNASSAINWTNISISALGTVSKGEFEAVDNATLNLSSCTFTDMSTFIFQSNSTVTDSTFRRCGQITSGGATFDGCLITNSTAAVSVSASSPSDIEDFTDCTFVSDGSNHAMDLGTVSSTVSYNWNNSLSGYAGSDGSTGNEAIKVNVASSQTLTINVGAGYTSPSIYNTGPGTVSVVSGQVTTTVTVKDLSTGLPIEGASVLVWVTDNTNYFYQHSYSDTDITGSGNIATVSHTGHGLANGDYVIIEGATNDDDYNGVFQVTATGPDSYTYTTSETLGASPATGTILGTFALISGTTSASGVISDTRSLSSQDISGWVRKASGSPYYEQGAVSGTVDGANGLSVTVQLLRDE